MSMMNINLVFCYMSANIRFQRCFGLGCLEFEAGHSSIFIDQHMLHTIRSSNISSYLFNTLISI